MDDQPKVTQSNIDAEKPGAVVCDRSTGIVSYGR